MPSSGLGGWTNEPLPQAPLCLLLTATSMVGNKQPATTVHGYPVTPDPYRCAHPWCACLVWLRRIRRRDNAGNLVIGGRDGHVFVPPEAARSARSRRGNQNGGKVRT